MQALVCADVDDVLLTGDVTHRGRRAELMAFERLFAPLANRLVVVPGNHDRLGDDVARQIMPGARVQTEVRPGLLAIRFDSTAPHNRRLMRAHGELTPGDVDAISRACEHAPPGALVVLMLHHHLYPLPADHVGERLASLLGWPNAEELALGIGLIGSLQGRCDLVLHGHRHTASERVLRPEGGRRMCVVNAGCTPELGRVRVVAHAAGRIVAERWLALAVPVRQRPVSFLRPRRGAPSPDRAVA